MSPAFGWSGDRWGGRSDRDQDNHPHQNNHRLLWSIHYPSPGHCALYCDYLRPSPRDPQSCENGGQIDISLDPDPLRTIYSGSPSHPLHRVHPSPGRIPYPDPRRTRMDCDPHPPRHHPCPRDQLSLDQSHRRRSHPRQDSFPLPGNPQSAPPLPGRYPGSRLERGPCPTYLMGPGGRDLRTGCRGADLTWRLWSPAGWLWEPGYRQCCSSGLSLHPAGLYRRAFGRRSV